MLLLAPLGCKSPLDIPAIDQLESMLGISISDDAEVIGGRNSSENASYSGLWLIASNEPLPLPPVKDPKLRRLSKPEARPKGTSFSVSALSSVMAACEVKPDAWPSFTGELGAAHNGRHDSWQYAYREAATERGWLTVVEVFSDQESE